MNSMITRRPFGARISLIAAATAVTLTVCTIAPPAAELPSLSPSRVAVTQDVALTATVFEQFWAVIVGEDPTFPLPAGVNPVAPITEQVVRSAVTYTRQLVNGQGQQIPAEISAQVANLAEAVPIVQGIITSAVAGTALAVVVGVFATVIAIGSLPESAPNLIDSATLVAALPLQWVASAFAIRNVIATALQPPAVTAAVVATEPETGVAPEKPGATRAEPGVEAAPTQLNTQPEPDTVAVVATEPETGVAAEKPAVTGAEPGVGARLRALVTSTPPITKKIVLPTSTAASLASESVSPAVHPTRSAPARKSDRPAAAMNQASQIKSGHAGRRRFHQRSASEPGD
jgi:hypothetical protein